MLAYLAVPTKLLPPLTGICLLVLGSKYLLASPKSMMYTIFAFSPLPIMKLLALISRCTKPFLWIISSRVMIWIPILRVVAMEKRFSLHGSCYTIVEIDLLAIFREGRWPWRCDHGWGRYRNRTTWRYPLFNITHTDALKELIQFDLVLQLSVTLAFLLLNLISDTILAA